MLPIKLKMKGVWKIHLFGLFYPRLMQKADPNHVGGERNALVKYVDQ